jgi:acetyltransferase-like isoleucine patch superfamily enzyme
LFANNENLCTYDLGVQLSNFRKFYRPLVALCHKMSLDTPVIHGDITRVHVGNRVGLANCIINTASGQVFIGDNVIFGYNVLLVAGTHLFRDGRRASLSLPVELREGWGSGSAEVPNEGRDISIGAGAFIGSGVIVVGGVSIGENSIIGAGAVVTKSVPPSSFAAGIPARVLPKHQ